MTRCILSDEPFWCLWGLVPAWAQWALVGCVLLMLAGFAWRLYGIAKAFGGWPAAVGAIGIVGVLAAIVWPRRPAREPDQFPHPDGEPAHPRPRPVRPGRQTILRRPGEDFQAWLERITTRK